MSATENVWVLDPARNEYYYFSAAEQAYIYQSGNRIPLGPPAPPAKGTTLLFRCPKRYETYTADKIKSLAARELGNDVWVTPLEVTFSDDVGEGNDDIEEGDDDAERDLK
jgi:hypothetical protein